MSKHHETLCQRLLSFSNAWLSTTRFYTLDFSNTWEIFASVPGASKRNSLAHHITAMDPLVKKLRSASISASCNSRLRFERNAHIENMLTDVSGHVNSYWEVFFHVCPPSVKCSTFITCSVRYLPKRHISRMLRISTWWRSLPESITSSVTRMVRPSQATNSRLSPSASFSVSNSQSTGLWFEDEGTRVSTGLDVTQLHNPTSLRCPETSNTPPLPEEAIVLVEDQGCLLGVAPQTKAFQCVCIARAPPWGHRVSHCDASRGHRDEYFIIWSCGCWAFSRAKMSESLKPTLIHRHFVMLHRLEPSLLLLLRRRESAGFSFESTSPVSSSSENLAKCVMACFHLFRPTKNDVSFSTALQIGGHSTFEVFDGEASQRNSYRTLVQCFIEWSLSCSLVLRNVDFLSSLFSSKICEIVHGGPEIFSRSHRSSLSIIIIGYQEDVFVPLLLVPGCAEGDVDRRESVQMSAIIFCPSMNFLRFSILCVTLPSEHDEIMIVSSCSSLSVSCFSMVFLSLSFVLLFTSWEIHSCKVIRNYHSLNSGFLIKWKSSRRQMPQEQKINPPVHASSKTGIGRIWIFVLARAIQHCPVRDLYDWIQRRIWWIFLSSPIFNDWFGMVSSSLFVKHFLKFLQSFFTF